MKSLRHSFCLIAILFIGLSAACAKQETGITWGKTARWKEWLNIHESPITWLSVNGKRFENVKGRAPYFLSIPSENMIFFVTSDRGQNSYTYHFYSLSSSEEVTIPVQHTDLGSGIGYPSSSQRYDWVEQIRLPKIVLLRKYLDRITEYKFDLELKTVVEESRETTNARPESK